MKIYCMYHLFDKRVSRCSKRKSCLIYFLSENCNILQNNTKKKCTPTIIYKFPPLDLKLKRMTWDQELDTLRTRAIFCEFSSFYKIFFLFFSFQWPWTWRNDLGHIIMYSRNLFFNRTDMEASEHTEADRQQRKRRFLYRPEFLAHLR